MTDQNTEYILITGAGEGIGWAMCRELAQKGYNIILVALPNTGLDKRAEELQTKYQVKATFYEADLTIDGIAKTIYDWTKTQGFSIVGLINNAGMGYGAPFQEVDPIFFDKMLRLNLNTTVGLSRLFLPDLMQKNRAYIVNYSSLAAFHPTPFKSVYSASKTFVLAFSKGLATELKDTSVTVTTVCPGPTLTNPGVRARIESAGKMGKFAQMTAEEVATEAIQGMLKGKKVVIPGKVNKWYRVFVTSLPRKMQQRMLANVFIKASAISAGG